MSTRPTSTIVRVDLGERGYDIIIGTGLLGRPETYAGLPAASDAVVVSNETVAPLYYEQVRGALCSHYRRIHLVSLPDGESYKNWATLNRIFDAMLEAGCDRKTVVFALGGGVVGDMAGFAASSYMRGVPYVQLPTTLLAQVDSSVGGKTAINHPLGKNMIGTFYQPVRVIADLDALQTLASRELSAGLAEVIKYGPIADAVFLEWLEQNLGKLLELDQESLIHAVRRSCEIKARVVGADERESGMRAILNFGHTFGHAIESGLGYGEWLHGEAVGCGMVMASDLSTRLGMIAQAEAQRVKALVARARLPTRGPDVSIERYLSLMRLDKKSEAGEIRFVLIDRPGHAIVRTAADETIAATLRACSN